MKTVNDIPEEFRPIFEELRRLGWKQSMGYSSHTYVLAHPKTGIEAMMLGFPEPHVGIISKAGTTLHSQFKTLDGLYKTSSLIIK